jgi:hypothetical protein
MERVDVNNVRVRDVSDIRVSEVWRIIRINAVSVKAPVYVPNAMGKAKTNQLIERALR